MNEQQHAPSGVVLEPVVERPPLPPFRRRLSRRPVVAPRPWWQNPRKLMAIGVWFIACAATWQSVESVFRTEPMVTLIITLVTQAVLTWGESPFWRGKWHIVSIFAVIADTVINVGGVWPFVARLDRLPFWQHVAVAFQLQPGMRPIPTMVLSVVFAFLLAYAPEYIWRDEDEG